MIPAMSFDQRQQLFREDDDMLDGTETDALNTAPPGEEGVYMSHVSRSYWLSTICFLRTDVIALISTVSFPGYETYL